MITGTIHDVPTIAPVIDPAQLAAINQLWWHNSMMLGYFCLGVGFLIGIVTGYYHCKRKYQRDQDTYFLAVREL
jgi:uncharacterized membrane protein affecting hemolysin expression